MKTKDLTLCGVSAAMLAVISQISIPVPGSVPITIQVLGVALVGTVLGSRLSFLTIITYILLGAAGLPVFSNFRGGIQILTGMTGGYILAWPIMAFLCGLRFRKFSPKKNLILCLIAGIAGLAIVELLGGLQWAFLSGDKSIQYILIYSMTAFVPKDILLTIAGILIGRQILKRNSFISS